MIDAKALREVDTRGMHETYDRWPEIARERYDGGPCGIDYGNISHVVFSGMGGSGAIGDIFSSILSKTGTHVEVVKGYVLPKTVDSESLVVATSISGNTEETLSVMSQAADLGCKSAAFSDGGRLEEMCEKRGLYHARIPMLHSPRASFPAFLFSILSALGPFLPIREADIADSLGMMEAQGRKISSSNLTESNPAVSLAGWMPEIPMIYYPWGLQAAATRFKNSLQENAKMHAAAEDVIEACHNGIVSWDRPGGPVRPILIRGADDYVKTSERWEVLKEFFAERGVPYREVRSVRGSILSKLINLIYLLDYASIYRAVMLDTDPTSVRGIDRIKAGLDG